MPDRDRQSEERLQQAVEGRGVVEVGAADDVGDGLVGVVEDDGEVIGHADVAAGEDDVADIGQKCFGINGMVARMDGPRLVEGEGAGGGESAGEVEADRVAGAAVGHRAMPARAGINRRVFNAFLWGAEGGPDVGAGAAAGVGEGGKSSERNGIAGYVLGLAQHRLGPGEAEPGEVLEDARLVFGAGAGGVKVFDSQEKLAAGGLGQIPGGQGREGVAEMQPPGRRGGEAGYHGGWVERRGGGRKRGGKGLWWQGFGPAGRGLESGWKAACQI